MVLLQQILGERGKKRKHRNQRFLLAAYYIFPIYIHLIVVLVTMIMKRMFRRSAPTVPSTPPKAVVSDDENSEEGEEEDEVEEIGGGGGEKEEAEGEQHQHQYQMSAGDNKKTVHFDILCDVLFNETLLLFLEWKEIGRLSGLCRKLRECSEDDAVSAGLWMCICRSLGYNNSLYVPDDIFSPLLKKDDNGNISSSSSSSSTSSSRKKTSGSAWKNLFFESLWPARGKWGTGGGSLESGASSDFKINVCVRFRPLAKNPLEEKLSLPLHQYIKLQRQQARNSGKVRMKNILSSHETL
jgi:hypothetical protein